MATTSKTGDKPVKAKSTATTKAPDTAKVTAAVKPKASVSKAEKVSAQSAPVSVPAASTTAAKAATKAPAKAPVAAAKKDTQPSKALRALAPDQRRYYVEVAAYYIAEQRGFHEGSPLADWVAAEAEIDRLLSEGILNP